VQTDKEWQDFCRVIGNPPWTTEPKFSTLLERKKHEEELNHLIEAWTINHRAEEVEKSMQKNGVPAGVVKTTEDLLKDPQLKYRHHFWKVNHTEIGEYSQDGITFHLSKTPGEIKRGGNCLGEHTAHVCLQILCMSAEEFVALDNEGLFK
jgi:crotonobetainyl-CoA:carnitine CoA-transferase CaiB-like acyl-CoA transferase